MKSICTIGISGYSGTGKTTLIRMLLPELKRQGLAVGILKHIHHKLNIDSKGKDTDLFYRAGADFVSAHDDHQGFARYRSSDLALAEYVRMFPAALDLIIVEGHKDINIPGIWLEKSGCRKISHGVQNRNRRVVFRDNPEYIHEVLAYIRQETERFHSERPLKAGLLIGGKSRRMGIPKSLLKIRGVSMAVRSFVALSAVSERTVLLGSGETPRSLNKADRLPDIQDADGPLAGMLSAFRWAPDSAWIISSVDMPLMNTKAWQWLLSQRRPGVWAVLPKIRGSGGLETTGAVYEPAIFEHAEAIARCGDSRLQDIAEHPKVITPMIPNALVEAWSNVNTPAEWEKALRCCVKDSL